MENNTNQSAVVGIDVANGGEVFNDYENNTASGRNSHSEGEATEASAIAAHAEGSESKAMQIAAHAEGDSFAAGHGSHAENGSVAEGDYSHSEGYLTKTMSANAHSENAYTIAAAQSSHAEGDLTLTEGIASHSEGESAETTGNKSHAEGKQTKAGGDGSHAEGEATEAIGADSHAEGKNTRAVGARSFAGGNSTVAAADNQTVIGTFNLNRTDTLFEIGNGASDTERSNAFEVYSDGSVSLGGEKISPSQLQSLIDMLPALGTGSATALWLQAGKPILDTVESASDERWFEFVPSETGKHVIYSEGNINIKATLFDSELTPLASDNSGGWGYNFRIYANLTCGEKYYICVQSETGSTGSYYMNANALSAMQEAATSEAAATITEFKKGIIKEYNTTTGQIWHKFTANAAEAHVDGGYGEYYISIACDGILNGTLYNSKMELIEGYDIFQYSNAYFAGYELAYGEEYYFCSEISNMPVEYNIGINFTKDQAYCGDSIDNPIEIKNIYEPVTATISTPGEEKWFKFTVNGNYNRIVVHSLGKDVHVGGQLFDINKKQIAADNEVPEEGEYNPPYNFVISYSCGSETVFYVRVTARGDETGTFQVCWTDEILAESIEILSPDVLIKKRDTMPMTAKISPSGAINNTIIWSSSNEDVAVITPNGVLIAKNSGNANITARVKDTEIQDIAFVSVINPLEAIVFDEPLLTLYRGESKELPKTFYPPDADDRSVEFFLEDSSIIKVENGKVIGLSAGTTTVTVKSRVNNDIFDTCTVRVLENVIVREDSYSYNLEFENGLIWKHVGVDLVNDEWNGTSEDAARSEYNRSQAFSEKQLAYIYLFDPLGLEHYMTMYGQDHGMKPENTNLLYFKDRVFEGIYGQKPRLFRIMPDETIIYFSYEVLSVEGTHREDFNSESEVIFGAHKVKDALAILDFVWELFSFVSDIPGIINLGIEMYQAFYFAGSFVEGLTEAADLFLKDYVKDVYDSLNPFNWYTSLINAVVTITSFTAPPNLNDIQIYNKVTSQEYVLTCNLKDGKCVTLQQILNNNLNIS